MTSPIFTAGAAIAVVGVAGRVFGDIASGVKNNFDAKATAFDDVLRGDAAEASQTGSSKLSVSQVQSMIDNVSNAIRDRLAAVGIGVNPPLEVSVKDDGQVEVTSTHDHVAEIESLINLEPAILEQLQALRGEAGVGRIVVSNFKNP